MAALTNDGNSVIQQEVIIHRRKPHTPQPPPEALDEQYSILSCVDAIKTAGASKIALQFPDELLEDAPAVCARLKHLQPHAFIFILADTTFDSCIVDEVAALHAKADFIIHFGYSILASPPTVPSFHVFGTRNVDTTKCVQALRAYTEEQLARCSENTNTCKAIVLLFDTDTYHSMGIVWETWCQPTTKPLPRFHGNVLVATIPSTINHPTAKSCPLQERIADRSHVLIHGMEVELPEGIRLADCAIFFVGDIESPIVTQLLFAVQLTAQVSKKDPTELVKIWDTDASDEQDQLGEAKEQLQTQNTWIQRRLQRRWFLLEKIKESSVVGVVAASGGIAEQAAMVNQLRQTIRKAGKRCVVLMVGKPSVAKLANFDEIDVFVLVSSVGGSTQLDDREYNKPILTPLDAILGLIPFLELDERDECEGLTDLSQIMRTSTYFDTDFRSIMTHPLLANTVKPTSKEATGSVSLTSSNTIIRIGKQEEDPESNTCTTITKAHDGRLVQHGSTAVQYFKQRTYQGLDPEKHQADKGIPEGIVEGLSGVASVYNTDIEALGQ